ncbi:MAG: histidine--tRNA ligase [Methanomassiliicoccales archaeon]
MIKRPRGTRDFGPEEMERRRRLEFIMRETARTFGFREVATPIFEHTELFTIRSGPNIVEEIYAFQDKGGREIALRPELTAPVIRFFVNEFTNHSRPLKLFYMGPCFRYERPQSGRYREFYQFGVEIIGNQNPETDAEVIALAVRIMESIGLEDFQVKVGHIGILRDRLALAGIDQEEASPILQKLDKKLYDEARPLMEKAGMGEEDIEEVFRITRLSGAPEELEWEMEGESIQYLREVFDTLALHGVEGVQADLGVVRGLDYYTGVVFEVEAPRLGAEKQVAGGGSYSLSELFGGERVFSTGFAIGFDRVQLALEKEGEDFLPSTLDAFVVPVSDETRSTAFQVVSRLRSAGVRADVDLMRRSMGKNLKFADSVCAKYAIIVGPKELEEGSVTVRDMETGDQSLVRMEELVDHLRSS